MFRQSLAVTLALCIAGHVAADPKKDLSAMAGKWKPTSMKFGGREAPEDQLKAINMTIEGDKYSVIAGNTPDKGTLKLGTKDKIKTMDIVGTEGPNKGKTIPAIYEIEGDQLKVCYALDGDKRPTEFKATGDKILLITYRRQK